MRLGILAVLLAGCFVADAFAGDRVRYPRVYGATGRPYGPTQAHYQYQRRYGRPWHGYGGQTAVRSNGFYYSAPSAYSPYLNYGYGYYGPVISPYGYSYYGGAYAYPYGGVIGAPGFYNYGPVYSYTPLAPQAIQAYPAWVGRDPFDNDVLNRAKLEEYLRWKAPLQVPATKTPPRLPAQSTPAAKLKSIAAQAKGDDFMDQQKYGSAYERYRTAFQVAPERAEPYFRTGFALVAMKRYASAVKYFQRGLQLDPKWPEHGVSLGKIYGRRNSLAKNSIIGDATQWAKADIRDPDRLFILGVLLHFDNQSDNAATLFEAAWRLSGGGEHLKPFLQRKVVARRGAIQPKVFEVKPKAGANNPAEKGVDPLEPPKPPVPGNVAKPKPPEGPLLPPLP